MKTHSVSQIFLIILKILIYYSNAIVVYIITEESNVMSDFNRYVLIFLCYYI